MKEKDVKRIVKKGYAKVARRTSCCSPSATAIDNAQATSCCQEMSLNEISRRMGYTDEELAEVPESSNLGLGCGNPVTLASVNEGEIVLDLGSGAGVDCFLAANRVGKTGKVIGVDMTPEMVKKARKNAKRGGYETVEFKVGEIENLPVTDSSVDVIISNCVVNLSPDKEKVFQEAFRVLKPGGRMIISDIVLLKELPASLKNSEEAYISCVAGAVLKEEYMGLIEKAGFINIDILGENSFPPELVISESPAQAPTEDSDVLLEKAEIFQSMVSIKVRGEKPG